MVSIFNRIANTFNNLSVFNLVGLMLLFIPIMYLLMMLAERIEFVYIRKYFNKMSFLLTDAPIRNIAEGLYTQYKQNNPYYYRTHNIDYYSASIRYSLFRSYKNMIKNMDEEIMTATILAIQMRIDELPLILTMGISKSNNMARHLLFNIWYDVDMQIYRSTQFGMKKIGLQIKRNKARKKEKIEADARILLEKYTKVKEEI